MELNKITNVKKFGKKLVTSLEKTKITKEKFDGQHGIWRGEHFVKEVERFEYEKEELLDKKR